MPGPGDYEMDREAYAEMYGPTTGDMVRLADTDLWIKVEKDCTSCLCLVSVLAISILIYNRWR